MPFTLSLASEADIEGIIACGSLAFANDVLNNAIFSFDHADPEAVEANRIFRIERAKKRMQTPSRWIKAVDDDTGKITGYATWNEPEGPMVPDAPGPSGDVFGIKDAPPSFVRKDVLESVEAQMKEAKKRVMGGDTDFWYLQSLAVHPAYQGRGIGKQLVEAGLEYVDETEKAAYLESSPAGAKLYPRCGFEVKETMSILDGATVMSIMVRPAKTKISNDSSI